MSPYLVSFLLNKLVAGKQRSRAFAWESLYRRASIRPRINSIENLDQQQPPARVRTPQPQPRIRQDGGCFKREEDVQVHGHRCGQSGGQYWIILPSQWPNFSIFGPIKQNPCVVKEKVVVMVNLDWHSHLLEPRKHYFHYTRANKVEFKSIPNLFFQLNNI